MELNNKFIVFNIIYIFQNEYGNELFLKYLLLSLMPKNIIHFKFIKKYAKYIQGKNTVLHFIDFI